MKHHQNFHFYCQISHQDCQRIVIGVGRGYDDYEEDDDYVKLNAGSTVNGTVSEGENENEELGVCVRVDGREKSWAGVDEA